jgi:putative membrane protein
MVDARLHALLPRFRPDPAEGELAAPGRFLQAWEAFLAGFGAAMEVRKDRPMEDPLRNPARVRDHLANERTYLAWMRTAIALMGFGVVIVRLRYLLPSAIQGHAHGWELGLLFALVGLLTVLLSTFHFLAVRRAIDSDTYTPGARWILLFSLAVGLLGAGVLYLLFTSPESPAGGSMLVP